MNRATSKALFTLGIVTIATGLMNCRKPETLQSAKPDEAAAPSPPEKPPQLPTRVDIPVPNEDPDRWLSVQKVADKAKGGWATGSFDSDRNKLSVHTSDVEEFAL